MAAPKKELIEYEAPRTVEAKAKAAALAIAEIEKTYGKGAIVNVGKYIGKRIPSIRTGLYALDNNVIQTGGFPRGRVIELFGPESSGKTTLLLLAIAQAQKAGELCAFIDAEHAFDPNWAKLLGVNVDALLVSQPDYGEQALDITETLVRSGAFAIVGVDSVAALVPKAELDGEMGQAAVGLHARLMSQALRKLTGIVSKSHTALVFINQIREKIGVMFGNPETTTGGRALKFYSSLRLDIRAIAWVKDGDENIGRRIKIKAVKNKVGAPFRETEAELMFDRGWDVYGHILDLCAESGIVDKSGAWYSYKGERIGQGRQNVSLFLNQNQAIFEKLYAELEAQDEELRKQAEA